MAVAIPYGDMIIKGSQMGVWNTSPGAIFLFVVLVGLVNVALRLVRRGLALDKSELAVVYILLLIANTLPARGFTAYVMPIATGAQYYATPENDWAERLLPFLPAWATVQDERVVRQYYEGADQTQAGVPWDAWAAPLLYWLLFGLALYLVMVCVSVVLRRQWVERERLVYPTMQLPLHMIEEARSDAEESSPIPPFFKNRVMWLGFLLPFLIGNINALHNYFHYIPSISTSFGSMTLFRGSIGVGFTLSFTLLGFSFLISRNIAAGLCFFYLINVVEQGLFRLLGIKIDPGPVGAFGHYAHPIVMYQAMGGMIVLVLIGLWNAREPSARGLAQGLYRGRGGRRRRRDNVVPPGRLGRSVGSGRHDCLAVVRRSAPVVSAHPAGCLFRPLPDHHPGGGRGRGRGHVPAHHRARLCLGRGRHRAAGAPRRGCSGHHLRLGHGRAHPADERLRQRPQTGRADRPPQKALVLGHYGHGSDHTGRFHVDPPGDRLCARSHQPQPVLRC